MSTLIGRTIGPYQVVAKLGEGGMGEVYRARDTSLNRDVAIKVLAEAVAADPDRLARFKREAEALAALNHPNIAQIYGIEGDGPVPPTGEARPPGYPVPPTGEARSPVRALVMELVDGRTLEEVMTGEGGTGARGPIALEEALPIARQIAAGLEAAHERGIIHRDLKPANVKVRDDGTVKVLDFGLAKAVDGDGSGLRRQDASASSGDRDLAATMTTPAMTEMGMILGTAAYMSPEQARGRSVDRRADIWAFGVVLFEMLSGERLFVGDTVSDTVAAVLREAVPWDRLPADTPPRVRRLLERCLDRDAQKRLRDIGDARLEIDDELAGVGWQLPQGQSAPESTSTGSGLANARVAWVVAALAIVVAGWAWFGRPAATAGGSEWRYFTQLTDQSGSEDTPAISPDGTAIAYSRQVNGSWDLFVQRIGGSNPSVVAGDPTRDEQWPAFSPDGQTIAFHEGDADGGLFVVGATGENARRVTDAGFHPTWSADGKFLAYCTEEVADPHGRSTNSQIWTVDVATGEQRKIFDGDGIQPSWSPSGSRIAFWSVPAGQRDLYTMAADGTGATAVIEDADLDWGPTWSPDGRFLYFASERGGTMSLWRIAIEEATGRALGDPEPVVSGVQTAPEPPDSQSLVFYSNRGGTCDAWRINRDGSGLTQLSTGSTSELGLLYPFFNPAGDRLYGVFFETGQLFTMDLDAALPAVPTELPAPDIGGAEEGARLRPTTAAPGGRLLAGVVQGASGSYIGVGVYDLDSQTARLVRREVNYGMPRFLSDGRLIYTAGEELVVMDVDGGGRRVLARDLPFELQGVGVAVAPDGRTLFLSGLTRAADIWMVERER